MTRAGYLEAIVILFLAAANAAGLLLIIRARRRVRALEALLASDDAGLLDWLDEAGTSVMATRTVTLGPGLSSVSRLFWSVEANGFSQRGTQLRRVARELRAMDLAKQAILGAGDP
jgi:hypothetical protein